MTDDLEAEGKTKKAYLPRSLSRWMPILAGWAAGLAAHGQFMVVPVSTFGVPDSVGANSSAPMIQGSDGAFYGTTFSGGGAIRGTVYRLSSDGGQLQVLHRFTGSGGDGAKLYAGVIEGSNGMLYGVTGEGGISNQGTIFCLNRDGSNYEVLHAFTGVGGDGAQAFGGLIEGSDGLLYGTTRYGGTANKGTVFRLNAAGDNYQVIHHFTGTHAGGAEPIARVVEGPGGKLYGATFGVTIEGTVTNLGTIYSLNPDGTEHAVLRRFTGLAGDGGNPYAELSVGQDGLLYGTTVYGGDNKQGIIFRIRPDGSSYQRLHSFYNATGDGSYPVGPVLETSFGRWHGTTPSGGESNNAGIIYMLQGDGTEYRAVRSFVGDTVDGRGPYGGLAKSAGGVLYGTTWSGGPSDQGTLFKLNQDGSGYQVLHYLTGGGGDAVEPYAGPVQGSDGALYGTSWSGGTANWGTVYRVEPGSGVREVLHHFTGGAGDGASPYGGVIEGSDGVLYGTTIQGGTQDLGVIYKLNKNGSGFALLRSFTSASSGGYHPYAGLFEASDGMLYGATLLGGTGSSGTIFRINRSGGSYSVLRNFQGGSDGANPYTGVMEASDGFLYGVTTYGGDSNRGLVYRIRRGGGDYRVLRRFTGSEDGWNPYGRLLEGTDGQIYGTTGYGGRSGSGTVFRVTKTGSAYSSLYQFDGTVAEGVNALGGLTLGADGKLYGTTALGGQWGHGTLFCLNQDGSEFTVQHHFQGEFGDGANPSGELVRGSDGIFYGTATAGGIGCGMVFRLVPRVTLRWERDGIIRLNGPTGFVYRVEGSVQIAAEAWQNLTNVNMTINSTQVAVPEFGTASSRFLRAVVGP